MAAGSTPKIFLSHSNQDRDLVLRVAADLVATRASVWFARWELSAGDSIVERINDGLADSSHLLVFLSPAALVSSWVKRELSAGLMRELSDKAVTVVCALAPGCRDEDVPALLRDKIWLDFREDYVTGVADLLDLFRHKRKSSDLLFQRGTELLSQDKPDKAIPLFRRSIKQYRANYDAMYNLGAALQRTGDEVAALELFERVSNARPQHALYRATLGRKLVSSGQMDRGLNCLREAARADAADSQSEDVLLTVALGLQAAEAHEEAVASFESYLTLNPGNSQVRYLFARSLRESGALERAVAQYRLLMAEEGGRPAVLIDFAATLVRANDPATNLEAVELYERAAAIAPHRAEPHEFLAHFYFDRGRITDSLAQLRATISIEPENLTAQYNLASVLRYLGRRQDAIAEYYRALEIAPGFERAREELRDLLIASSTPPAETAVLPLLRVPIDATQVESDEAWPRRVAGAPNLALNYDLVQSAYVGVSASDWETSMAEVQRLDRYVELVKRLKAADETEGPPDRDDEQALQAAIHELDDFVTANRGADVRRHDLLGIIHMRLGNLDKALVHFRTSVGLFPSGTWIHVNLGLAYFKDGQLGRAIEEWEMAFDLGFEDCTLRLHTALLLSELGLVPQTIAAYRRFLDHCPDHTAAPEIRSLLERLAQVDRSDETADEQLPPEPERRGPLDEW